MMSNCKIPFDAEEIRKEKRMRAEQLLNTLICSRLFNPFLFSEICALTESANGFDSTDDRTLSGKLMLVVTELHEGVEWCQTGMGDPLEEELADVMIRLFAMIHAYVVHIQWDGWTWRYRKCFDKEHQAMRVCRVRDSIEQTLWPVVAQLSRAMEAHRHSNVDGVMIALEQAVAYTAEIADALSLDWEKALKYKAKKNLGRGYLHGKSRSV
jgi:hypothetical protein